MVMEHWLTCPTQEFQAIKRGDRADWLVDRMFLCLEGDLLRFTEMDPATGELTDQVVDGLEVTEIVTTDPGIPDGHVRLMFRPLTAE
jgi:hypothetical protein